MVSNILRTIKATLLRRTRKFSKSQSCDTIASFYAGPEHLRDADDLECGTSHAMAPSVIPTLIVTSSSQDEPMLAAVYAADIEAPMEDDDDDDDAYEESYLSEHNSDYSNDTLSTLSSITSNDDSFEKPNDSFISVNDAGSATATEELEEDLYLNINSLVLNTAPEPLLYNNNGAPSPIASPEVGVAAVHKRLRELLELADDPESVTPQTELKLVDDIDIDPSYHIEWLTDDARQEAQSRSRKIQRTARIRCLDLSKVTPLKADEHPEPQGHSRTSVLKGQGRSSPLKSSWNMDGLEEEW